jgi:hypothetical protein
MDDIEKVLQSLRTVESNDDYRYQRPVDVDGVPDRKIGAYGILASKWAQLAEASGIRGATWNDRMAQDHIARWKVTQDYQRLGDWNLTAIGFRFGMKAAMGLLERKATEPATIEGLGVPEIAEYMRRFKEARPSPELPVTGRIKTGASPSEAPDPDSTRADNILRKHLYTMRDSQRKMNESVSATADVLPVDSGGPQ